MYFSFDRNHLIDGYIRIVGKGNWPLKKVTIPNKDSFEADNAIYITFLS